MDPRRAPPFPGEEPAFSSPCAAAGPVPTRRQVLASRSAVGLLFPRGLTGKRPLGRDSTKASRKKAMTSSSQSTDYLSRIHEIQMARLKQSEDKSEKKQENIEFLKDVELKNLEVRTKEIEMQQAKFRFEDRLQKNAELKELLAMDMDQLPEDVRPAYLAKRKGLVEFFVNNPV